ncbi:MAG: penicillin-binding transpeptidase domain-containing protein [Terricaulis sp.]
MADVFISYKRDERPAVEKIAGKLQDLGLSVWFDAGMTAGETFNNEIDREARAAKCILVCWSPTARESKWVIAEAMIGFEKDKLIASYVAGPDIFSPPTPLNAIHAEDLRGWLGDPSETHAGWKSILRGIGKLCGRVDVESFGALGSRTSTAELRSWQDRHRNSPLFVSVEELLRAQEIQDVERERLGREAREQRAREDAERQAREAAERERREGEERVQQREREKREAAERRSAIKRPLMLAGIAILVAISLAGLYFVGLRPAAEQQITAASAQISWADGESLVASASDNATQTGYFTAEVMRQANEVLDHEDGLRIRVPLDRRLQEAAVRALRKGLDDYDRRHRMAPRSGAAGAERAQGALVAMNPHTGRVLAMLGGYDSGGPNRATQTLRQPGSAFSPIVYAAALDFGLTPTTLVEDAPLSAAQNGNSEPWSDGNTAEYFGPMPWRRGLELSRSTTVARVAQEIGTERVLDYGRRLGVYSDNTRPGLALALGAGETSLLRLTTAYGMFVNGGRRIQPIFIDSVQNSDGRSVFTSEQSAADTDAREQVLDPLTAFQVVSMTEGVVQRGTGSVVQSVGAPLGGKTGTSADNKDAWFIGYSPDLVVGIWVGFDAPRNMGEGEGGARIAAPIFRDFMRAALAEATPVPFAIPAGLRAVRIDRFTGLLPSAGSTETIIEWFRPGTEPQAEVRSPQEQNDPSGLF